LRLLYYCCELLKGANYWELLYWMRIKGLYGRWEYSYTSPLKIANPSIEIRAE